MEQEHFKILIVDDSLLNQEVLRRILAEPPAAGVAAPIQAPEPEPEHEPEPYGIITAKSGLEALEKVTQEKPDLILLDIVMPGMSGFDVLARLQESSEMRRIPVIIISGLDYEGDEEKGLLMGAVDYVAKPFKKSVVLARIKTNLKIVEQMHIIERLSMVDTLTNMPNRRSFDARMDAEWGRAIREKTPVSFLMIDIDKFKLFNDNYGHHQGDVALKTVAGAIQATLKRLSDMAARWGGEEFAVLLPNTPIEGALKIAEQIRANIEATLVPSIGEHPPLPITASLGATTIVPDSESSMEDFFEQADQALYTAKETGRNRVCSQIRQHPAAKG